MRKSIARTCAAVGTVAASALLAASPAVAAPDQSTTLTAAKPSFAWDGGPGFGVFATSTVTAKVSCDSPGYDCDTVLVQLPKGGNIDASIAGDGQPNTQDLDLHVYFSDKDGTQGDLIAESATGTADEAASTGDLDPGYYLVLVDYYVAVAGTYKGQLTFTPTTEGTQATKASSTSSTSRKARRARVRAKARSRR